ncbi:MAG TPA: c-type cytochrome [Micropepsaceae bacterium]|nr:c-type cytochrome [Micropepsaceae bacterium]
MKVRSLLVFLAACVGTSAQAAEGPKRSDEAMVRAGHNIAVTTCVGCHTVSPKQTVSPVLGPGIPSFEEIANRPDVTAESLRATMKVARWHDDALASRLLPMSHISDKERAEVAAYIVSLRRSP